MIKNYLMLWPREPMARSMARAIRRGGLKLAVPRSAEQHQFTPIMPLRQAARGPVALPLTSWASSMDDQRLTRSLTRVRLIRE